MPQAKYALTPAGGGCTAAGAPDIKTIWLQLDRGLFAARAGMAVVEMVTDNDGDHARIEGETLCLICAQDSLQSAIDQLQDLADHIYASLPAEAFLPAATQPCNDCAGTMPHSEILGSDA